MTPTATRLTLPCRCEVSVDDFDMPGQWIYVEAGCGKVYRLNRGLEHIDAVEVKP